MQEVFISFIIPAFNCEQFLERCCQGLLMCKNHPYEIIIIDDGSTDRTPEICDRLAGENRNIRVVHKKNEGQGIARNIGVTHAAGKYTAFIDADDVPWGANHDFVLDKIARMDPDWIICNWNTFVDGTDAFIEQVSDSDLQCVEYKPDEIRSAIAKETRRFSSAVWNKIYKTSVIKDNGIVFESERKVISEDFLFNCDYSCYAKTAVWVDVCVYSYRVNNASFCHRYQKNYFNRLIQLKNSMNDRSMDDKAALYYKLFTFIKTCVIQEADFKGIGEAYVSVRSICKNKVTKEILQQIDAGSLNKKNRVIAFMIKYQLASGLVLLYKIKR